MKQENTRRLIRIVAIVGGTVLAVILIFALIRLIFFMPAGTQTAATDPLINTSTSRGVMMSVRGPITASENARSYEISVTPTSRAVTVYNGYDGTVLNKQVYTNSVNAYEQFVYALDKAGMTNARKITNDNTRGVCATGRLYTFALERDTTIESSLWTSSCSAEKGTLSGSAASLHSLFDTQIPDIAKYRGGII